jgi:hypothetical protein
MSPNYLPDGKVSFMQKEPNKFRILVYPSKEGEKFFTEALRPLEGISTIYARGQTNFLIDEEQIEVNLRNNKFLNKFPFIVSELHQLTPLFSRHHDSMPYLELDLRTLAAIVMSLAENLQQREVECVIYCTPSSHHIYSQICELACRLVGIVQIFQDGVTESPFLVPILQRNTLEDSHIVNLNIDASGVDEEKINEWLVSNKVTEGRLMRKRRYYLFGKVEYKIEKSSFTYAVAKTMFGNLRIKQYTFRRWASRKYMILIGRQERPATRLNHMALKRRIELLLSLRRALNYYRTRSFENLSILHQEWEYIRGQRGYPIVLFANYQPEASSFPQARPLHNIVDLIVHLRASGVSVPIFYKEHPSMRFFYQFGRASVAASARSEEFYRTIEQLGCILVPFDFDLGAKDAFLPLTYSGTVCIERSLIGLKTISLGRAWFKGLPGVIPLETFLNEKDSSNQDNPPQLLAQEAQEFLVNLIKTSAFSNEGTWNRSPKLTKPWEGFLKGVKSFLDQERLRN